MATKRIKFIKPWNLFGAGAEVSLDAPIADLLIANGRAKEVQTPAPKKTLKKARKSKYANR